MAEGPPALAGGGAWQMSQKPPVGLVLRLLRGHSDTVRALEAATPRPHPLPLSLSVSVGQSPLCLSVRGEGL